MLGTEQVLNKWLCYYDYDYAEYWANSAFKVALLFLIELSMHIQQDFQMQAFHVSADWWATNKWVRGLVVTVGSPLSPGIVWLPKDQEMGLLLDAESLRKKADSWITNDKCQDLDSADSFSQA